MVLVYLFFGVADDRETAVSRKTKSRNSRRNRRLAAIPSPRAGPCSENTAKRTLHGGQHPVDVRDGLGT